MDGSDECELNIPYPCCVYYFNLILTRVRCRVLWGLRGVWGIKCAEKQPWNRPPKTGFGDRQVGAFCKFRVWHTGIPFIFSPKMRFFRKFDRFRGWCNTTPGIWRRDVLYEGACGVDGVRIDNLSIDTTYTMMFAEHSLPMLLFYKFLIPFIWIWDLLEHKQRLAFDGKHRYIHHSYSSLFIINRRGGVLCYALILHRLFMFRRRISGE